MAKSGTPKKQIDFKLIKEQVNLWGAAFDESIERSQKDIDFVLSLKQWSDRNKKDREGDSKKCLQFSVVSNVLAMATARAKTLQLKLHVNSINNDISSEESQIMNLILNDLVLDESHKNAFANNVESSYTAGYSVYFADIVIDKKKSLSKKVKVINLDNDNIYVYFDPKAPSKTFHDGDFAGMRYKVKASTISQKYPKKQLSSNDEWVDIYDHFYRRNERTRYVKLVTGEYVNEALAAEDMYAKPLQDKFDYAPVIYHTRYMQSGLEGILLEPAQKYPCSDLPFSYNFGLTYRHKGKVQAMPLIHPLRDAQMLLNYVGSQIAEQVTDTSADKLITTKDFINSKDDQMKENATNFNKKSGVMAFNHLNYNIERGQTVNPTLIETYQLFQGVIMQLAGSMLESDASELVSLSGVAVDKMREPQDLLQNNMIKASVTSFNTIAQIVQEMIPRIYTEQRTLYLQSDDGETEIVTINQPLITDKSKLKYNIRDLTSDYHFKITGDISTRLKQQNTVKQLGDAYQLDPGAAAATMDIYMECLDTPYADELKRAIQANMTPQFLDYRSGKMTLEEYQSFMQQQQSSQPPPPQVAIAQGKLQVENGKLQNQQRQNQLKASELQIKQEDNQNNATISSARLTAETSLDKQEMIHRHKKDMLDNISNILGNQ